jgi:hypothetical protein
MKSQRREQDRTVFDLIEEATHLLRTAPAGTLAAYYVGGIPFVLGLLFFWSDMSRSPLASQHLAAASLGMAGLFFWMKLWQTIFARRVRAQIAREPISPLSIRGCLRILVTQAILQPSGLFVLPLAAIPVLPLPWACAFYQNVAVLDDGQEVNLRALLKNARKQAALWPVQNYALLGILVIFAVCVFLNWLSVGLAIPFLFKTFFGVESDFTRGGMAMFNTTFLAAMLGLTYLSVDPILKIIYALRCFYGESLQSGEDLKAELKPFAKSSLPQAAVLAIVFSLLAASPSPAQTATNQPASLPARQSLAVPTLDQAINQTIHESKYVWRMPRQQVLAPDTQENAVERFFDKVENMIREWARDFREWLHKVWNKLFPPHETPARVSYGSGYGWIMSLQFLLYGLAAAAVIALALLLYRVWRGHQPPPPAVATEAIQPAPDLADENVHADQLPEDGWTKLARELLERGEFRLAMRAFYLAGLAGLAERNLITIARFKSNRDYERELRRRAHSFPELLAVFGDNVSRFERIWYGMHEASRELALQFANNLEKLKGGG